MSGVDHNVVTCYQKGIIMLISKYFISLITLLSHSVVMIFYKTYNQDISKCCYDVWYDLYPGYLIWYNLNKTMISHSVGMIFDITYNQYISQCCYDIWYHL